MTKKIVFFFGLGGVGILAVMIFLSISGVCYHHDTCMNFFEKFHPWSFMDYIFFTPPLFLLSLITYKMRDEVFKAWIGFAIWFVPLSMIAILLTPVDDGGSWSIPLKGPVALLTTGLFFVISLSIICWKHFALRKK